MEVGNPMFFNLDRGFEAFWKEARQAIQAIVGMC